jgi:ATP-dependent Clp protease ATP-binding subunit ClpC
MLLQIMEDGHLADAKGRKVDFRNTIVIMTSNVGSSVITREAQLGFSTQVDEARSEETYRDMKSKLMKELKRLFRPEFLNRVDEVVVFHELLREDIEKIVDIQLVQINDRITDHGIKLVLTEAGRDALVDEGFDPQFGARPLRRALQRLIEDPLAERMLQGEIEDGDTVWIDADGEDVVLRTEEPVDEPETLLSGEQL